jgi:hypothetical protein
MTDSNFVSIPDLELKSAGATIWWKLRDVTTRLALSEALHEQGVDKERWLIPAEPSPERCLRRAIKGLREYRRLIRPLKGGHGWALVSEKATEDNLEHATDVIVKLNPGNNEVLWEPTYEGRTRLTWTQLDEMEDTVRKSFEEQFHTLNHGDLSAWLLKQVHSLNAVTLREGGGVYFIPPSHVSHWNDIGETLKVLGESRAYSMQAIRANDAVEAVFDSLVDEATAMAAIINTKMDEGSWGVRAMHNRIEVCEEFMSKVKRYGGFLDTNMDRVLQQVEELKTDLSAAILAADDEDDDGLKVLGVG